LFLFDFLGEKIFELVIFNCIRKLSPLGLVVSCSKSANNPIYVLAACITDPALVITFVNVDRKLAFVMIAVRALKEKLVVGPIGRPENIS
jgi:hypothetical protein